MDIKGSDVLEVLRRAESRSPLRGVAVKLLALKRSSLHDAPRQQFVPNFQSPRVAMTSWPPFVPPVRVASSRPRRRDFFLARHHNRPYSEEPVNIVQKKAEARFIVTNQRAPRSQKWAGAEVTLRTAWIKGLILPGFCVNDPPAIGSSRQVPLLQDAAAVV